MHMVINGAGGVVSSREFVPVAGGMQFEAGRAVSWKR
jgi:hypothetical protein